MKKKIKNTIKRIIFYFVRILVRPFFGKNIWLVSDREWQAGDNGEAFFEYIQKKGVKSCFAITRTSEDYNRMRSIGKVIAYDSLRHKILLCTADVHLSSHLFHMDTHKETTHVFLQHGVAKSDITNYIMEACHKNFYIVVSTEHEKAILMKHIRKDHILLTGLPRYDRLHNDEDKRIIVSLTWRHNFGEKTKLAKEIRKKYFDSYNAILKDDELHAYLRERGYRLCVKLHPLMEQYRKRLHLNENVETLENISYAEMFAKGSLLITDYSSIDCDFAYLRKPVLYYQFDNDTFWERQIYDKGEFDYVTQGFGEVTDRYGELKELIKEYADHGCRMKKQYEERVEAFFTYHDKNNCERIYKEVMRFMRKKQKE